MADTNATPQAAATDQPASSPTRALGVEVGTTTSTGLKRYVDVPTAHDIESAARDVREAEVATSDETNTPAPQAASQEAATQGEAAEATAAEASSDADDTAGEQEAGEYDFDADPPEAFDYNYYSQKIDAKGELSDADYQTIETQLGVTRDMIDDHITMIRDRNAAHEKRWMDAMGGTKDKQTAMLDWARENYSPAEMATYNKIMGGRDIPAIDMAVRDLASRYTAANPEREPTVQLGQANRQSTPTNNAGGYESMAAYQKDRRAPEYKHDAAFRERVNRKLAATPSTIRRQQAG